MGIINLVDIRFEDLKPLDNYTKNLLSMTDNLPRSLNNSKRDTWWVNYNKELHLVGVIWNIEEVRHLFLCTNMSEVEELILYANNTFYKFIEWYQFKGKNPS